MFSGNFKVFDYILFSLALCVPTLISIYVGFYKNKHKNATEYLYGKNNLGAWTIGLSLYSGTISSLGILGTASEIYVFGTQFLVVGLGSLASSLVVWYLVLPVFCGNLNLKTPYEYFERRFDKKIRVFMSVLILLHSFSFMSVVLYVSIVSFSQLTNIPLVICSTVVGTVCTMYCLIGGFVGVIWTDVIQATLMLLSCFFVMIKGIYLSGGPENIWLIAKQGDRLHLFNFDPNPFVRLTFWSAFLGMCALNTTFAGCSPKAIQRFMAVKDEKSARISSFISTSGYLINSLMSGIIGLCIYTYYYKCDPLLNKQINTYTELLPYFITEIAGYVPGFIGFFSAGLLSAGLSSISADMNVMSGSIYYDVLQNIFDTTKWKLKDTITMKIIAVFYGIIVMILAPICSKSKYIYSYALSIGSFTYGPVLGVTILGTTCPKVNAKGTLYGIITSVCLLSIMSFHTLTLNLSSKYALPTSTENCINNFNNFTDVFITTENRTTTEEPEPFILFKLSYLYYTLFGAIVTMVTAAIVSYLTGHNNKNDVNPNLIIPQLRKQEINIAVDEIIDNTEKNY